MVGATYDAELDVEDSIELGRNATITSDGDNGISMEAGKVVVTGVIESRDGDGMTYLRVARDCLLMIESDDDDLGVGSRVRISLSGGELQLTPMGG
ncbi:hypothetical protein [Enhygromyxa salina]|uniref:hypothetical protein n=1 Tax=Enhygromyxa salina TaxID=215803 RepID=UPI000698C6E2|nr:hypothetical protein [Enhygromyxa salina]